MITPALFACRPAPDRREARDFERMREQQRYDAYDPSGFFANGAVLQAPPAHTIARSPAYVSAVQSAAFLSGKYDTTAVAAIPVAIDDRLMQRGAEQFAISCAPCHGAGGFGGGIIAANLPARRPPSLRVPPVSALPAGRMFAVITDGFGAMPPYGWQMPVETRWAVIAYVQSLGTQRPTAATQADSTEADRIHHVDSLHASHASLAQLLAQPDR